MNQQALQVSIDSCFRLLQQCISKRDLSAGRKVHVLILRGGFESNSFLGSHLIRMFALCGSLLEANNVFVKVVEPTVFTWNSIITAHARLGQLRQAIELYLRMRQTGIKPNQHVFVAVLGACMRAGILTKAHVIHSHIIETGLKANMFVGNSLINVYAKCGSLEEAYKVFDYMPKDDVVTWNTMVAGYTDNGCIQEALLLFELMLQQNKKPDNVTFVSILKACSSVAALNQGKLIHGLIMERGFESDVFVGSSLIDMYTKCGSLENAQALFDSLPKRDVVIWSALIAGYVHHGHVEKALQLFMDMQGCGIEPNVVLWNTMIAGYVHHGQVEEALRLFKLMQQNGRQPDNITFISILKAYSNIEALDEGRLIHSHITKCGFEYDVYIGSALIDMYIKCGSFDNAKFVFSRLPVRDIVTWNAMISGCYLHKQFEEGACLFQEMKTAKIKPDIVTWNAMIEGHAEHENCLEALGIFQEMQQAGMKPDGFTFSSILKACPGTAALDQSKLIHAHIIESGLEADVTLCNALITVYANCGSLKDACIIFDNIPKRDVVTWNAIISGCALHDNCLLALHYFDDMLREALKPDDLTFASLLSACSHIGQVGTGLLFFKSMRKEHDITPTAEHYNCMVDLFGRAGYLLEAEDLVQTMPFQPDFVSLTALLGHSRSYGNVKLGRQWFDIILLISHNYASWYVLMEDTYAGAGMWMESHKIIELKKNADAWKKPGKAFIEINDNVHEFFVRDKSHSNNDDMLTKLKRLCVQFKGEGWCHI